MATWRGLLILIVTLAILFLLQGCGKEKTACVYVLIDQTAGSQAVREMYTTEFKKVVEALGSGDMIGISAITENSEQTATTKASFIFPTFNVFSDSELVYKAKVAQLKNEVQDTGTKMLSQNATNSDIMGGFRLAGKILSGQEGQKHIRRILIIFTDGIEQENASDFTRDGELSGGNIQQIIDREQKLARLPDLKGVEVHFVGVYLKPDPQAGITREKMSEIQEFWTKYCAASGTTLDTSHYGPNLTDFNLE